MRTKKKDIRKKRVNHNDKRRGKPKTKKKIPKQKGGALLSSIGVGLAATAVAATAYKGFRLINKIKDKSYILKLLNQDYIEYSPKVVIVETKDFMNHYLQCIGTLEFFQMLLSRPEYLTSKTLRSIIKETTNKETLDKKSLDSDFSNEYSEIEKILMTMNARDDITSKFELRPTIIETNKDKNINELKDLLLLTARIPGSGIEDITPDTNSRLEKITPYLTVSTFKWQDIIISGIYDEYFDESVNSILNERDITTTLDKEDMERIQSVIEDLSENKNFMEAIRQKMVECSSKPRGYLDYVSSNITWDSQQSCLSCPQEDCLIYIYDFYYDFLKEDIPDISILDKLYCLMICEARICVLSKCLALEAIRIEDKNDSKVRQLVHNIYIKDKESPLDMITNKSLQNQSGGGGLDPDPQLDTSGDLGYGLDDFPKSDLDNLPKSDLDNLPKSGLDDFPKSDLDDFPKSGLDDFPKSGLDDLPKSGLDDFPKSGLDDFPKSGLDDFPKSDLGSDLDKKSESKSVPDEAGEEPKNTLIYGESGEVTNPIIAEYNGYIKEELKLSLKTKKHLLCKFLDVSEEIDDDKLIQMYLNYKAYDEITLSELLVGIFKPFSIIQSDNDKINLSSFISMTFDFIKKKGMIPFDMIGIKFLLKPGILFKNTKSLKNEDELAISVKELYMSNHRDHSLLFLLLLLIMSGKDDNDKLPCKENLQIKSLLNKLNDEINEYLLTNLFADELKLLTKDNKELLKRRIFIIYKSSSENVRRFLRRVDILPFNEEDEMCEMNPPDPVRIRKSKTFKRKSGQRNMRCIEKENEIMNKIRNGEKVIVDSTLINVLERCSKNDIIITDDKGESIFDSDETDDNISEDPVLSEDLTESKEDEKEIKLDEVSELFKDEDKESENLESSINIESFDNNESLDNTESSGNVEPSLNTESSGNVESSSEKIESKDSDKSEGFISKLFGDNKDTPVVNNSPGYNKDTLVVNNSPGASSKGEPSGGFSSNPLSFNKVGNSVSSIMKGRKTNKENDQGQGIFKSFFTGGVNDENMASEESSQSPLVQGQPSTLVPEGQSSTLVPEGQPSSLVPEGQPSSLVPEGQSSTLVPGGQLSTPELQPPLKDEGSSSFYSGDWKMNPNYSMVAQASDTDPRFT